MATNRQVLQAASADEIHQMAAEATVIIALAGGAEARVGGKDGEDMGLVMNSGGDY